MTGVAKDTFAERVERAMDVSQENFLAISERTPSSYDLLHSCKIKDTWAKKITPSFPTPNTSIKESGQKNYRKNRKSSFVFFVYLK